MYESPLRTTPSGMVQMAMDGIGRGSLVGAIGIFVGQLIPESWSLDFTLALTFIALVVPVLQERGLYKTTDAGRSWRLVLEDVEASPGDAPGPQRLQQRSLVQPGKRDIGSAGRVYRRHGLHLLLRQREPVCPYHAPACQTLREPSRNISRPAAPVAG